MSFWEKFKEFDKMMSEPAISIRIEKTIEIPQQDNQVEELIEENDRLKRLVELKKVESIETKVRLIE